MTDQPYLRHETDTPWEYEIGEEGRDGVLRWRTLLSGERTPTEGISMGTFELPPGARLEPGRDLGLGDRAVALVVLPEDLRTQRVAAPVPRARRSVDLDPHVRLLPPAPPPPASPG